MVLFANGRISRHSYCSSGANCHNNGCLGKHISARNFIRVVTADQVKLNAQLNAIRLSILSNQVREFF